MKNEILISILIPTYNRVTYLKECLDSVLIQKWFLENEIEIIVSDNSDNNITENFINEYKLNNKNKIIIYNKNTPNIWPINNFNKLLELKKWYYFIFLSDDDIFFDDKSLISLYEWIKINNYDLAYGNNSLLSDKWIKEYKSCLTNSKKIFYEHNIWFWWTLYKDYWCKYDLNAWLYTDYDFNVNYVINKKITYIDYNTVIYRLHEWQSINSIPWIIDKKMKIYIFNKFKWYKYNLNAYFKIFLLYYLIKFLNIIWIYYVILKIIKKYEK